MNSVLSMMDFVLEMMNFCTRSFLSAWRFDGGDGQHLYSKIMNFAFNVMNSVS